MVYRTPKTVRKGMLGKRKVLRWFRKTVFTGAKQSLKRTVLR